FNGLSTPEGLASVALSDDHFVCCLPDSHPLANEAAIELAWLEREPFVIFSRDAAPSNYDNIISLCTQAGFHPLTRYAARQWLTVAALVASGLGVALVPGCVARSGVKGARFVPLKGAAFRNGAF
nr:LysR family transcriptional regulator [Pseudomonas sp.]